LCCHLPAARCKSRESQAAEYSWKSRPVRSAHSVDVEGNSQSACAKSLDSAVLTLTLGATLLVSFLILSCGRPQKIRAHRCPTFLRYTRPLLQVRHSAARGPRAHGRRRVSAQEMAITGESLRAPRLRPRREILHLALYLWCIIKFIEPRTSLTSRLLQYPDSTELSTRPMFPLQTLRRTV
jgi:hypothetical protein